VVFGPLVQTYAPAVVEVLGLAGFDFVVFDREHGPLTTRDVEELARACGSTMIAPLVRMRHHSTFDFTSVLDTGVAGVHVPRVESPEDVESVVRSTRFHPLGNRGLNPFVRAANYSSQPVAEFTEQSNNEVVIVIAVEGQSALSHLDSLLDVPGIDVVFLGPYDISHSLGIPGQVSHPRVVEAVSAGMRKIRDRGVAPGVFASTVEGVRLWLSHGVQYVVHSVDTRLCFEVAQERVQQLRETVDAMNKDVSEKRAAPGRGS
jgi:4-hydroxy-2-oxoheptanedioate aldolase